MFILYENLVIFEIKLKVNSLFLLCLINLFTKNFNSKLTIAMNTKLFKKIYIYFIKNCFYV